MAPFPSVDVTFSLVALSIMLPIPAWLLIQARKERRDTLLPPHHWVSTFLAACVLLAGILATGYVLVYVNTYEPGDVCTRLVIERDGMVCEGWESP